MVRQKLHTSHATRDTLVESLRRDLVEEGIVGLVHMLQGILEILRVHCSGFWMFFSGHPSHVLAVVLQHLFLHAIASLEKW